MVVFATRWFPALRAIRSRMITRTWWFVMKQAAHFHVEQTGYELLVNLLHVPAAWLRLTPLRIIREVRRFVGPTGLLSVA
jgi:hypothetical protein